MIAAFLPCWELDRFFWHWEDRVFSGKLPANRVHLRVPALRYASTDVDTGSA